MTSPLNLPAPGRCQAVYIMFPFSTAMFLLNSCLDLFSAPRLTTRTLYPSYRVNLPSSLTVNHSSASVFSTRPRVSVYGTGAAWISLADFLGSMVTSILRRASSVYSQVRLSRGLPTGINIYTLQPAIPSAGRTVTSPSPRHSMRQYGNINPFFHRRRRSALP